MEHLFPRALVACIGEGRSPEPEELAVLTDKVGREAFPRHCSHSARPHAHKIARAAFAGHRIAR